MVLCRRSAYHGSVPNGTGNSESPEPRRSRRRTGYTVKTFLLTQEQRLQAPLNAVFPFFSRPENLERLTPGFLGMELLTPRPIPMHVGAIIDYVVRMNGMPMRWTTCISEYEPPHRFVDVQLKGPYSFWHHTHTFEAAGDETWVRDEVRYMLPFGPIGQAAHTLFVRRQLDTIFGYRRTCLSGITDWSGIDDGLDSAQP